MVDKKYSNMSEAFYDDDGEYIFGMMPLGK
jgi:hypothetical protein